MKSIEYKITIPEGLTTKKILEIVSKDEILKGLINQNYVENEGDFLPETYFFSYGYSRNSLLERMKKELIILSILNGIKEITLCHTKVNMKH